MIDRDTILKPLIEKGSYFTEAEKDFIVDVYQKCKESENPFLFFEKEVIKSMERSLNHMKDIFSFSFSLQKDTFHYAYNKKKNMLYDIASVTKFFTLALVHVLEKQKILSYDEKVISVLPDLKDLSSLTIEDLLMMKGKIETDGKLSSVTNQDMFLKRLATVHPVKTDQNGVYTDIGFTILRFLIEEKIKLLTGKIMRFDEIMDIYLFKPYHLSHILYQPDKNFYTLLGNGNRKGCCHDQKTRIIDSINGSAGLFASIDGMDDFLSKIIDYKILSPSFIKKIFSYSFLDTNQRKRSYAGLYLPCCSEIPSYAARCFSHHTLAHQGFTGATVLTDFDNHISIAILVDAMREGALTKGDYFLSEFRNLYGTISLYAIVFSLLAEKVEIKK